MNWLIIVLCSIPACVIALIIIANAQHDSWVIVGECILSIFCGVMLGIGVPLGICKQNMGDKYDWYMETRLKYAEANGIEKEYLETHDVMAYNLWYEQNKVDIENPWNFKSVLGCEFDYIKVGD
jgi:hypothetical protein